MNRSHTGHETPIIQRLHITFGKFGALRYTSHLDIAKVWERVLRRADLPILYTKGFNTRPRFQLATALALGITSECEIIDVALRERMPDGALDDLPERIMSVSPAGLTVVSVVDVPVNSPALQTLVRSATYRLRFVDPVDRDDLQKRIDALLAQERIIKVTYRKKKKSVSDLRPLILSLELDDDGDLIAHLSAGERGNLRPDEVIAQMGLEDVHVQAHRMALHIEDYANHTRLRDHER